MPDLTTNLSLNKPKVNDPTDQDLWGGQLNTNMDTIDNEFSTRTIDQSYEDKLLSRPELKDYAETIPATVTITSGAATIDFEDGNWVEIDMSENLTSLTINNPPATGKVGTMMIYFKQSGVGSFTATFPGAVDFGAAGAPTLSTASGSTDLVVLNTRDAGATFAGILSAGGFTTI